MSNRIRNQTSDFSILLSFNELAWVAICGMAVFLGYNLVRYHGYPTPESVKLVITDLNRARAELSRQSNDIVTWSNRAALAEEKLHLLNSSVSNFYIGGLSLTNRVQVLLALNESLSNRIARLISSSAALASSNAALASSNAALAALNATLASANASLRDRLDFQRSLASGFRAAEEACKTNLAAAHLANVALSNKLASATNITTLVQGVHQALLGLRGPMSNVVLLLDRSGSMLDGNRWDDALGVVKTWLEYLPIQRCSLVTFSDRCDPPFPIDGGMVDVGGTNAQQRLNRQQLLAAVGNLRPQGNTHTLDALRTAYKYKSVDTIILFTDGEPYVPGYGKSVKAGAVGRNENSASKVERENISAAMKAEILKEILAPGRSRVPINVVALGDYFQENQSKFLLKLATNTGGAFLGR